MKDCLKKSLQSTLKKKCTRFLNIQLSFNIYIFIVISMGISISLTYLMICVHVEGKIVLFLWLKMQQFLFIYRRLNNNNMVLFTNRRITYPFMHAIQTSKTPFLKSCKKMLNFANHNVSIYIYNSNVSYYPMHFV